MKKQILKKAGIRLLLVSIVCFGWYFIKNTTIEFIFAYPVFIFAIIFFAIAWFDYLNLDGVSISKMSFVRYSNNITNKVGIDDIPTQANVIPNDGVACVYGNLVTAIILVLPSVLFTIL